MNIMRLKNSTVKRKTAEGMNVMKKIDSVDKKDKIIVKMKN